jgi:hypothetical protein
MILNQISRLQGKPNSHAWNIQRSFRSNRFSHIPGYGSGPPRATAGPYAHQLCRTYVCSATTWSYSCLLCRMHSHTLVRVYNRNQNNRVAIQVLGLPLYQITRHVASTFKRLATTTTHCDLNNFYRNRQGKTPGHDTAHDPAHYLYSDCKIVNMQLLYRASDRKSPDFCQSY